MSMTAYHTTSSTADLSRTRRANTEAVTVPYLGASVPVGLAGASAVALFILLLDALAGHPLGTPNALGASLLRGEAFDPTAPIRPALVFGYTLLHVATFICVAAAAVSTEFTLSRSGASLSYQLAAVASGLVVGLQAVFLALSLLLDIGWVGGIGFERIFAANVIAALTMTITVHLRGETRKMAADEQAR